MVQLGRENFANAKPIASAKGGVAGYIDLHRALASAGDDQALFELGCAYSTGSHGVACDLIEAHKWFNLAASKGHEDAPHCRCEIAEEMTPREIAEAQRRARAWLLERSALNG